MVKLFSDELARFIDKIKNKEPFSLTRFHDGENYILLDKPIDITEKANGEFKYEPENKAHGFYRQELVKSLQYKHQSYYVGIMTGCCVKAGNEGHDKMVEMSKQDEEHMTFATLFFNSNYTRVKEELIPLLHDVILIVNRKADISKLPFKPEKVFVVGTNAWIEDYLRVLMELQIYIGEEKPKDKVFLFCAGPLSNMLIYRIHKDNSDNQLINVGSILDPYMFSEPTRWYQTNKNGHGEHSCLW
jgi:hypothetical protein